MSGLNWKLRMSCIEKKEDVENEDEENGFQFLIVLKTKFNISFLLVI